MQQTEYTKRPLDSHAAKHHQIFRKIHIKYSITVCNKYIDNKKLPQFSPPCKVDIQPQILAKSWDQELQHWAIFRPHSLVESFPLFPHLAYSWCLLKVEIYYQPVQTIDENLASSKLEENCAMDYTSERWDLTTIQQLWISHSSLPRFLNGT